MPDIRTRLQQLRQQIETLCRLHQRDSSQLLLLAVSKRHPAEAIKSAYEVGQRHFGESYSQEALLKMAQLSQSDLIWHFIGPIQSNKTQQIAHHFDWVHSVDRLKIAHRLSEQRPADLPALNICLQVNISNETSKSGLTLTELPEVAAAVAKLRNLKLRGLMAIPAPADSLDAQRQPFRQLAEAQQQLIAAGHPLDTLSMGMSDDLEAAIAEGSTIVRIGTAIFGPRD